MDTAATGSEKRTVAVDRPLVGRDRHKVAVDTAAAHSKAPFGTLELQSDTDLVGTLEPAGPLVGRPNSPRSTQQLF